MHYKAKEVAAAEKLAAAELAQAAKAPPSIVPPSPPPSDPVSKPAKKQEQKKPTKPSSYVEMEEVDDSWIRQTDAGDSYRFTKEYKEELAKKRKGPKPKSKHIGPMMSST